MKTAVSHQLRWAQYLHCGIDTAWQFFSSPHNLARITPPEMRFSVVSDLPDSGIYEGMIIDYRVSPLFSIPMKWQTEITQVEPYKSFTDYQKKGPYRLWKHVHEFLPWDEGVLMKDTVEYELPFGVLGEVAHRWIVKKKIHHIFDYRCGVLDNLFNDKKQET
ncbi:SRPBCC family protein [Parapedobacter pyrenivorans]|uniref:SRPBCC family protein n=1 Tax=Parapedobacter pyrenivorans TaxID=1305674 RepID=UPI00333FA685